MSARRNRVTPAGELIADPARGEVFGNRGCLHDASGQIRRPWQLRRWIACRLEFKGRRRSPLMQPGRYTELFFLDEATAWAAGHRPCAECRREDYRRFQAAWPGEDVSANGMDARLHGERLDGRRRRVHDVPWADLPDAAFVLRDEWPWVVLGGELLRWTPAGYEAREPRPLRGEASVLTPPSLLAVLTSGWEDAAVPLLHSSARR